ncbi:MAG TPA: acyl-CoA carboxylase subunit epsilon, partial [Pseudonocardiaceae bacterium]|nr:acyl-CoA carboxylase subunit epsilon [Pseudonocardiaceae bacterium]
MTVTPQIAQPVIRVLRGAPDDVELAAVLAVLATVTAAEPAQQAPISGGWGD